MSQFLIFLKFQYYNIEIHFPDIFTVILILHLI